MARYSTLQTSWLRVGLAVVSIAILTTLVVRSSRAAAEQRVALAAFSRTVALGTTADQVYGMCIRACNDHSGWSFDERAGLGVRIYVVLTPLTFGARNWVAYFVLEDGGVAAVLVRTEDTRSFRPDGSPADRVRDAQAKWLSEFARH
jgi:hypothetical protein